MNFRLSWPTLTRRRRPWPTQLMRQQQLNLAPETPKRPSQIVRERVALSDGKQHIEVTMERVSTGGTRYEASFTKAAGRAMTPAERAQKKRVRSTLFPPRALLLREKEAQRLRDFREAAGTSTAPLTPIHMAPLSAGLDSESNGRPAKRRALKHPMSMAVNGSPSAPP